MKKKNERAESFPSEEKEMLSTETRKQLGKVGKPSINELSEVVGKGSEANDEDLYTEDFAGEPGMEYEGDNVKEVAPFAANRQESKSNLEIKIPLK